MRLRTTPGHAGPWVLGWAVSLAACTPVASTKAPAALGPATGLRPTASLAPSSAASAGLAPELPSALDPAALPRPLPPVPPGQAPGSVAVGLASPKPQPSGAAALPGREGVEEGDWREAGAGLALVRFPAPGGLKRVPGPLPATPQALAAMDGWPVVGGKGSPTLVLGRRLWDGQGWSLGHRELSEEALGPAASDALDGREVLALAATKERVYLTTGQGFRVLERSAEALRSPASPWRVVGSHEPDPLAQPGVEKLVALAVVPAAPAGAQPDDVASLKALGSVFPLAPGSVLGLDGAGHRLWLFQPQPDGTWRQRSILGQGGVREGGGQLPLDAWSNPEGLAVRPDGRALVVADTANRRLVQWEAAATAPGGARLRLLAGDGLPGGQDGQGAQASFGWPTGLCYGPGGLLYVVDEGFQRLRQVGPTGLVKRLEVGGKPARLAPAEGGRLWVLDRAGGLGLRLWVPPR